ncbi:hypothetical protein D3875_13995 [Deinococcus cavernae]|uniref:Uncharacterized protein n=1 Tax=Deinococcus cavernae TaxID=2320857 RepID=A0A418V8X2_9DEIO|nr:hypothetical protein D3875_13995 [Deinococcus cavernae]
MWKSTPECFILRPAHLNSLALLGQKAFRSYVKCSRDARPRARLNLPGPCRSGWGCRP